jgi:hypothetical protein
LCPAARSTDVDSSTSAKPTSITRPQFSLGTSHSAIEVVSIEMHSPLLVLLALGGAAALGRAGLGLILLAERICTFAPRVSRMRKEDLLRRLEAEHKIEELHGRADGLAVKVLASGSAPERIDLVDDLDEPDDLLEDFAAPRDPSSWSAAVE